MKKLLPILILIFTLQTPSWADDIRDFQIEGMSIGDSLLDYFSEDEILADKPNWFKNNDYSIANNLTSKNFKTYTLIQASYKTKDKKYIIEISNRGTPSEYGVNLGLTKKGLELLKISEGMSLDYPHSEANTKKQTTQRGEIATAQNRTPYAARCLFGTDDRLWRIAPLGKVFGSDTL